MFDKKQRTLALLLATGMAAGLGCTSPDPEGRYDDFVESTEEDRQIPDMGPIEGGQQVDFSGQYFLALKTPLNTGDPFYFQADVTVDEDFSFELSLQPLKTDTDANGDARADARTAVGDPIVGTAQLNEDGTFDLDLGDVAAPGDSNPVTGSDIVAQIILAGTVLGEESFCGTADGMVSQPLTAPIAGSTFGTVSFAEGADLTMIEPLVECPEGTLPMDDAGMEDMGGDMGDQDAGPVDDSFYRCPDVDFSGRWRFEFKTGLQDERSDLILVLTESSDTTVCYTGDVLSADDESVDLGDVTRFTERDGELILRIPEFVIPPGANPALPNGGTSNITAGAAGYTELGACGEFETVIEPVGLPTSGTWSIIKEDATGVDWDTDLANSGCPAFIAETPCAFSDVAGEYTFQFQTDRQDEPTDLDMTVEASGLTCLHATLESVDTPGFVIARIINAQDDGEGNLQLNGRNFFIPGESNPIGDDPLWADMPAVTTELTPGETMCGTLDLNVFAPFAISSSGGWAAGAAGMEPTMPGCP